jgi:hypothetical protein
MKKNKKEQGLGCKDILNLLLDLCDFWGIKLEEYCFHYIFSASHLAKGLIGFPQCGLCEENTYTTETARCPLQCLKEIHHSSTGDEKEILFG